jgi:hypothetical protein
MRIYGDLPLEQWNGKSRRHRRKFFDAYAAARREFVTMIAASIGGAVLIVDADPAPDIPLTEVVIPPTQQ